MVINNTHKIAKEAKTKKKQQRITKHKPIELWYPKQPLNKRVEYSAKSHISTLIYYEFINKFKYSTVFAVRTYMKR